MEELAVPKLLHSMSLWNYHHMDTDRVSYLYLLEHLVESHLGPLEPWLEMSRSAVLECEEQSLQVTMGSEPHKGAPGSSPETTLPV